MNTENDKILKLVSENGEEIVFTITGIEREIPCSKKRIDMSMCSVMDENRAIINIEAVGENGQILKLSYKE